MSTTRMRFKLHKVSASLQDQVGNIFQELFKCEIKFKDKSNLGEDVGNEFDLSRRN